MSVTTFTDALDGLSITGVNRRVDILRIDANIADLPIQYTTIPDTENGFRTFGNIHINPIRSSELVVLVQAAPLGDNQQNRDSLITMADNVTDALESALTDATIDSYSLTIDPERNINGTEYLAIVAAVTGRDK